MTPWSTPVAFEQVVKKQVVKKQVANKPVANKPVANKPVANKPVATLGTLTHAALEAPTLAGDAHVRPGFARSPEDDRLFALGYPHLIVLASGHPDERKLEASALACFGICPYREIWPASLAAPMVRMMPRWREVWRPAVKGKPQLSPEGKAILSTSKPLDVSEVREAFDLLLRAQWMMGPFVLRTMFLAESVLGSEATAAFVGALEGLPAEAFKVHDVNLYLAVPMLGASSSAASRRWTSRRNGWVPTRRRRGPTSTSSSTRTAASGTIERRGWSRQP